MATVLLPAPPDAVPWLAQPARKIDAAAVARAAEPSLVVIPIYVNLQFRLKSGSIRIPESIRQSKPDIIAWTGKEYVSG
ncbi:MAG: hypothetical protein ACKVQA_18975 [Burkholderiales bacterium]